MPRYTLETIIAALLVLWLLGAFLVPFAGDFIHLVLLVIALLLVLRILQGHPALE